MIRSIEYVNKTHLPSAHSIGRGNVRRAIEGSYLEGTIDVLKEWSESTTSKKLKEKLLKQIDQCNTRIINLLDE